MFRARRLSQKLTVFVLSVALIPALSPLLARVLSSDTILAFTLDGSMLGVLGVATAFAMIGRIPTRGSALARRWCCERV